PEIARFVHQPPDDTRAWTRAMLLRIAGADGVQDVNWDLIRFRKAGRGCWPVVRTLRLDDPLGFTRAAVADVIERPATMDDILDELQVPSDTESAPTLHDWGRARYPMAASGASRTHRSSNGRADDPDERRTDDEPSRIPP